MDFPHSLALAFQRLGITPQAAKSYASLLQEAGMEQVEDIKRTCFRAYIENSS